MLISVLVDLAGFTAFQSWSMNVLYLNSSAASAQPGILALLVFEVVGFPHCGGFEQCTCSPSFFYSMEIWGESVNSG